jgi:hypothetical protein
MHRHKLTFVWRKTEADSFLSVLWNPENYLKKYSNLAILKVSRASRCSRHSRSGLETAIAQRKSDDSLN